VDFRWLRNRGASCFPGSRRRWATGAGPQRRHD
jgi:hypothetical protein